MSLSRVVWGLYVPALLLMVLWAVPVHPLSFSLMTDGWRRGLGVVFLVLIVSAHWLGWRRAGSRARPQALLVRLSLLVLSCGALTYLLVLILFTFYGGYETRARVQEAGNLAQPALSALEGVCETQGRLTPGATHATLGLAAPERYADLSGDLAALSVEVSSERVATVTAVTRDIGPRVPAGSTVVYNGTCTQGGVMLWEVGGTVPAPMLPIR